MARVRCPIALRAVLALAIATPLVMHAASASPAAATAASLTVTGGGYGHGVGLSQWGAYGYAVDDGWTSGQILDRYYGGTVAGTAPAQDVNVRLLLHDDRQTSLVNDRGALWVDGYAPGGPFRSVVVREVAGVYRVYARADQLACPAAGDTLDASTGWTQLAGSSASVSVRSSAETASSTPADLVSVCEPNGRVRSYRGIVRAVNGTDGENRTVNQVPLEQYLRSVVASEVPWTWAAAGGGRGAQAVQAQAVAARSYALAENRYSYARTCDLQVCQTYLGAAWRSSLTGGFTPIEKAPVDQAVAATAGVVRRVGGATGPIAYTMFSSSSGGATAVTTLGFTPVVDEGDDTTANPYHRWTATVSATTLQNAWPSIGAYVGVEIRARDGAGPWGGRVTSVRVIGSGGAVTVTGEQFRRSLGLRSTLFTLDGAPAEPPSPPASPQLTCGTRVAPPVVDTPIDESGARFTPIAPVRLVDTREGLGAPLGLVPAGCTIAIDAQVPDGASAVAVNVTSVEPWASGFVTAYPCGRTRPWASATQGLAYRVVAGAAIVPVGPDGQICVFLQQTGHLVVDLFGYFHPGNGDLFEPIDTVRRLDTRNGAMPGAGTVTRVSIAGTPGIPVGARGAALTVHALSAQSPGFVTVYPCSAERPWVSSLNVPAGGSVTNHVQVGLPDTGDVCVYTMSPMHLVVDVSGWYGDGASSEFFALTPVRAIDTREQQGLAGAFTAGANRPIVLGDTLGMPTVPQLRAVVGVVTTTEAAATGFITVHACRTPVPAVSMVRYVPGVNVAVTVVGNVDAQGRWCLMSSAATHLVMDVNGYFAG